MDTGAGKPRNSVNPEIRLRRVAPPERMVTLTLPERIVKFLSDHEQWHMLTGAEIGITAYAARKALAPETCEARTWLYPGYKTRTLPKGHPGDHRP